jgi:hypothetical protein
MFAVTALLPAGGSDDDVALLTTGTPLGAPMAIVPQGIPMAIESETVAVEPPPEFIVDESPSGIMYVTSEFAPVHAKPDVSATRVATLAHASSVTVDGQSGDWLRIGDGMFVPATDLAREAPAPEETPAQCRPIVIPASPRVQPGTAREVGQRMAAERGWVDKQWEALDALWTRESGWSTSSLNATTGAYGIPQALPATKMQWAGEDWLTNPDTQIRWGLEYISRRYGDPINAWAFFQANNWH